MQIRNNFLFNKDGTQVQFVSSPNTRGEVDPQYLVMHYTAVTTFESTLNHFKNPNADASAHLLIGRGGRIAQFLINIRSGPGTSFGMLSDALSKDTHLLALKREGTWSFAEVLDTVHRVMDLEGWVSSKFLVKPNLEI